MSEVTMHQLHDRHTRGETLSETELQLLQIWYDQQDAEEHARINQMGSVTDTTKQLQQQIAQAALQLQTVTQQISATISTNEALRAEIGSCPSVYVMNSSDENSAF